MINMDDSFRKTIEQRERETLSPYACLSENTRGREHALAPCPIRTEFIRDRDRILHCKSFRRLKHKTQVFLSPVGDHYRTRLTHTLEVSQITRTISRALRLNEDLTEAIALGHDLGHTPFGHAGEKVLSELVPGGFEHNVQSLRVVEKLENEGKGLNLTFEVRDGILNHTSRGKPATLEGCVVSISDRIAYINHDIDDAIRAGILSEEMLPETCRKRIGDSHGRRINNLIINVLNESKDKPFVRMSDDMWAEFNKLRDFLFENLYFNPVAKAEEGKAEGVIRALWYYYLDHVDDIPDELKADIPRCGIERAVADHIACMTDRYAIDDYKRLFVPKDWI